MKRYTLIFAALLMFVGLELSAQTQNIYTELKTADIANRNNVTLIEELSIANIAAPQYSSGKNVRGYRVRIFFDNSQSARTEAMKVKREFEALFPHVPCNLIYENPYFKVTVGNCLSSEEAIMLWHRVQDTYDRAFVIREDIPISELKSTQSVSKDFIDTPEQAGELE